MAEELANRLSCRVIPKTIKNGSVCLPAWHAGISVDF